MNRYPKHSSKETQIRAEMIQIRRDNQQILRQRYEKGDRNLRHTLFGNIRVKRTQFPTLESAEGLRFAYTQTSLPKEIGETILNVTRNNELEPPETTHHESAPMPTTDSV